MKVEEKNFQNYKSRGKEREMDTVEFINAV